MQLYFFLGLAMQLLKDYFGAVRRFAITQALSRSGNVSVAPGGRLLCFSLSCSVALAAHPQSDRISSFEVQGRMAGRYPRIEASQGGKGVTSNDVYLFLLDLNSLEVSYIMYLEILVHISPKKTRLHPLSRHIAGTSIHSYSYLFMQLAHFKTHFR